MSAEPGGFIPLSPPPSSIASSSVDSTFPQPRRTPLKAGGSKASSFIRYVDQKLLHIQRRFAKRDPSLEQANSHVKEVDEEGRVVQEIRETTARSEEWYDVPGYASFGQAAADVEDVVNVIWVSATPSLQVPYLISIALLVNSMIPGFPAAPKPLFRLLGRLDQAFASLLQLQRGVSGTEKVRIKSLVERTRICVVDVMSAGDFEEESAQRELEEDDGDLILENPSELDDDDDDDDDDYEGHGGWDMQVARVYDRTLVELGETMEGPEIGIRTQPTR